MTNFDDVQKQLWNNSDITFESATKAINLIRQRDIDFGDLYFERAVSEAFSLEEGIVKGGSFNISQGVGVRAVKGGKTGFAYSDVLTQKDLEEACLAARSITNGHSCSSINVTSSVKNSPVLYTSDDPIRSLSREQKAMLLLQLDKEARSLDPRITQVMANVSCLHCTRLVMPTDKEACFDIKPTVHISITVIMEHNGRRESGSASAGGAILLDELLAGDRIQKLAREAVRVADVNMQSVPAPAGSMTVVLGAGWPGVLVHEAVGHGLEGDFN
ncbi:MAG: PmbA/TldA family metallopeptidase, partial [Succinivibrio sp.]